MLLVIIIKIIVVIIMIICSFLLHFLYIFPVLIIQPYFYVFDVNL